VHDVIYGELVLGRVEDRSRRAYLEVIERLAARGAEGVVLGCTEIGMLIKSTDLSVPTFDTTRLHAEYAVDFALADEAHEAN
jgi:aspartate racemase